VVWMLGDSPSRLTVNEMASAVGDESIRIKG
jgi:hypothetical protein